MTPSEYVLTISSPLPSLCSPTSSPLPHSLPSALFTSSLFLHTPSPPPIISNVSLKSCSLHDFTSSFAVKQRLFRRLLSTSDCMCHLTSLSLIYGMSVCVCVCVNFLIGIIACFSILPYMSYRLSSSQCFHPGKPSNSHFLLVQLEIRILQ